MMFAHISDTHLGAAPYGLREREDDFYRVFREAVDEIIKDHIRVVVHSGDVLDEPRLPGKPILELMRGMRRLREAGTSTYAVLGEHDFRRVQGEVPILRTLEELGQIRILRDGRPERAGGGMVLVGFLKKRKDEIYAGSDPLIERLREAAELVTDIGGGDRKILVLHQGLVELHRHAGEMRAADLPPGFDYYAMGHLHDRAVRRFSHLTGPVVYPGSTETTGSEHIPVEGVEKGFFLVDVSGDEPRLEWVKLGARPHYRLELDYSRLGDQVEEALRRLAEGEMKPVLHLVIRGRDIDSGFLQAKLSKLLQVALTYRMRVEIEEEIRGPGKPMGFEEQLFKMASKALGDEEKAERATRKLLPLLEEGDSDGALQLLMGWAGLR